MTTQRTRIFWASCLVLELLVLFLYRSVFHAEYVWDDAALFVDSTGLRHPEHLLTAILEPIISSTTYFRPAVLASFVLEFKLFGISPVVSHVVNLCIQFANIALMALLGYRLLSPRSTIAAIAAVAFFSLHSSTIEPVAWVAGRFDEMVTLFILMGMVLALYLERPWRWVSVPLCFFLAASSKEMAVTFPVVWFALAWWRGCPEQPLRTAVARVLREHWLEAALILVAGMAYMALRVAYIPDVYHDDASYDDGSLFDRWCLVANTLYFYAHHIAYPFDDISPIHPISDYISVKSLVLGGSLALLLIYLLLRSLFLPFSGSRIFLLLGFLSLLPVLNILPLTIAGNIGHDRFLLMPLVFFALSVGSSIDQALNVQWENASLIKVALGILALGWSVLAVANINLTVPLWKSNLTLWTWAYARYPFNGYIQGNLLAALTDSGKTKQANQLIAEVRSRPPLMVPDLFYIDEAMLKSRQGNPKGALKLLKWLDKHQVNAPHRVFLRNGYKLSDAYLGRNSGVETWKYRAIYGAMAEAYLGIWDFNKASLYADYGLFYQKDYPPILLLKSVAEIGKGDLEAGRNYFLEAKRNIVPWGKNDPDDLVRAFVSQYCAGAEDKPKPNPDVCNDQKLFLSGLGIAPTPVKVEN